MSGLEVPGSCGDPAAVERFIAEGTAVAEMIYGIAALEATNFDAAVARVPLAMAARDAGIRVGLTAALNVLIRRGLLPEGLEP